MRTKINRGKQGRSYFALCKKYETESVGQLIATSVMNGQYQQAVEYFNMMKGEDQRFFLLEDYENYGEYGETARNLIVTSLWAKK